MRTYQAWMPLSVRFAFLVAVFPGIHQLLEPPYLQQIQGRKIGVLAHYASRTREGTHLVDLLFKRSDLQLRAIFAPEHGYRTADDTQLPDSTDPETGLPVYSLYGPRSAPTADELSGLDAVIIDLQDAGVRFYTYGATLALTLKACKAAGKKVFLLDRPNPIGGDVVEGAMLDSGFAGDLVSYASIPMRHGMTLGELALYYNEALGIGADLTIVPMKGWSRNLLWSDTDLEWRAPSPALVTYDQAFLYGFLGPMETLNLAVGRGIDNSEAFRIFGAPWVTSEKAKALADALDRLALPGLKFSPVEWTPTRAEYKDKLCRGFRVEAVSPKDVRGFASLISIEQTMVRVLGKDLSFAGSTQLLGTAWLRDGIEQLQDPKSLLDRAAAESASFLEARKKILLYP